ncbi:MAG: ABC transporter ATP-binding protein [Anaerolineae bacterium]|nr:ABC transporter ATP-binding protein [Anaerolineae bacterium]
MIEAQSLTFAYPALQPGDAPHQVFSELSLALEKGDALAVMGTNGSGKSTLGFLLAGLAPRYTGGTLSGGMQVGDINPVTTIPAPGSIGLLFQDPAPQLFNTTVAYEVAWGLETMGVPADEITTRVNTALDLFDMNQHANHPPWALSGGEQKRCALASIWAMHPGFLILDEPLNGLDAKGRRDLLAAIHKLRNTGSTILTMTQQQQVLREMDAFLLLENGAASTKHPAETFLTLEQQLVTAGILYPPKLWPDLRPYEKPVDGQPAVEISHLDYDYPGSRPALREVNLAIPQGQFVAIIGDNGAGKSTLARHMNGLLQPLQGEVRIMGKRTVDVATGALARHIGFLFQRPEQQLFAPTVRDEIAFGPRNLALDNIEHLVTQTMGRFNLTAFADMPPAILSYGTQRTVTLACLAAMQSPIIVLDEPTVGLDGRGWQQLILWLAELRASNTTIIMVTHELALASKADRVIVLDQGTLTDDGPPHIVLHQTLPGGVG